METNAFFSDVGKTLSIRPTPKGASVHRSRRIGRRSFLERTNVVANQMYYALRIRGVRMEERHGVTRVVGGAYKPPRERE